MKKLVARHITRPYLLLAFVCLVFGLVMTGLIPIGNGYIVNSQCTENGLFIDYYGDGCGGFSVFGMEHFLWHPRVSIATGVMLLLFEAVAWALLAFALLLAIRWIVRSETVTNPWKDENKPWIIGTLIAGLLLVLHFAAVPVQSRLLQSPDTCLDSVGVCTPCPGVMPVTTEPRPRFEDYGWPFHIVQKTYAADACGQQPVELNNRTDLLAVLFNWAFWSLLVWVVIDWIWLEQARRAVRNT